MMTLSSFLTKFRSCRGKLIKIKPNEKSFCEDISQRIENDPGLLDLNDLNDVDHCGLCGHLLHFLSPETWPPNVELSICQVYCPCQNLSCIATVSEELSLWQSTHR